jgi:ribonuclease P protein component
MASVIGCPPGRDARSSRLGVGVVACASPRDASPISMRVVHGVTSRRVFEELRTTNHRARGRCLSARYHPVDATTTSVEVAYAVGKQIGGAVERNRLRRRLRAIVADIAPELPAGAFLITPTPAARDLVYTELRAELSGTLRRVTRTPA